MSGRELQPFYPVPLCRLRRYLPHTGGERVAGAAAQLRNSRHLSEGLRLSALPPCGGDGRQARGG